MKSLLFLGKMKFYNYEFKILKALRENFHFKKDGGFY